jgi:hypothetical protein
MYGQYLSAVAGRALQPTTRIVEVIQILIAVAAPGIAHLAGVPMPPSDNLFTYVGYALAAFVVFRLLFVAPYELWREQTGAIGKLKLELSEPERKEIAHMASIRAEKRLELAAELRQFHWIAFTEIDAGTKEPLNNSYGRLLSLMGQAGVPESFDTMFGRFTDECSALNRSRRDGDSDKNAGRYSFSYIDDLTQYLHGRITAEQLALKLAEYPDEPELPLEHDENANGSQST